MNLLNRFISILPVLFIRGLSLILLFFSQVMLARVCSEPSEFGKYTVWLTCLNIIVVFLKCGTDTGAIRFIAKYKNNLEPLLLFKYRYYSLIKIVDLSLLLTIGVVIYNIYELELFSSMNGVLIFYFAPAGFLLAHSQYRRGELLGFGMPIISEISESIIRPTLVLLLTLLFSFYGYTVSAKILIPFYVSILALTSLIIFLIASIKVSIADFPNNSTGVVANKIKVDWKKSTRGMAVNVLIRQVIKSADILLCATFLDSVQVAFYVVATRLADLVVFALTSANLIFAPKISVLYSRQEKVKLNAFLKNVSQMVFVIGVILFFILLFFGKYILTIYGDVYVEGYSALMILAIGQLINAFFGPTGYLASMTGNQIQLTKALVFSAVISVIAYIILIPLLGIDGAALASMSGTVTWNLIVYKKMSNLEGLKSKAF